jgi:hypothetical protein
MIQRGKDTEEETERRNRGEETEETEGRDIRVMERKIQRRTDRGEWLVRKRHIGETEGKRQT